MKEFLKKCIHKLGLSVIQTCCIVTYLFGQNTDSVLSRVPGQPNIIIILADDMGYGDLSSYGHPLIRTENLDKMAGEGIRLTSFYAAESSCTPSRAALLTGRYALRSGLQHILFPADNNGLAAYEITLAETLKGRDYRNMCIGKWHLGQTKDEYWPTSQGFDHYYGLITSNDMMPPWVETDVPLRLHRDRRATEEFPVDQTTLTARYTAEAVKFIKASNGKPFFLYLAHNMPHMPLSVSDRFQGRSAAGLYGDVIEELDWSVGEILKTLKAEELDENTVVIFTSDNGPGRIYRLFKSGNVMPWHMGSAGLLRGHKGTSYEGGFRVPCIVRWPGVIPEKQTSPQVVTSMDLYTTLIELAKGKIPQDRTIDGVNVMPVFLGDRTFERGKDFYYFQGKYLDAIRSREWKLRIAPYQGHRIPPNTELFPELYNLKIDPSELHNRANDNPEIVNRLKKKLEEFRINGAELRF